ncbi:hypothetical protein ABT034_29240 [Streptomyces sp. NPDC002773]|uniref:hypothetical protein n=1 Tax=Streptomyces sp. NPDC002773 TaxID=3154430 RepID=UPI0033307942
MTGPRSGRKGDVGGTALLTLFLVWEAASGGSPEWLRVVFALFALVGVVRLARCAAMRVRPRARS